MLELIGILVFFLEGSNPFNFLGKFSLKGGIVSCIYLVTFLVRKEKKKKKKVIWENGPPDDPIYQSCQSLIRKE